MPDSYGPLLVEELHIHGVTEWEIDQTGRHNKLRFRWNDKTLLHVFPKTPSDSHGLQNSLSCLRTTLGVRRVIRKSKHKKQKRARSAATAAPPAEISVLPDPFAALAKLKEKRICPIMTLDQMVAMLNSAKR